MIFSSFEEECRKLKAQYSHMDHSDIEEFIEAYQTAATAAELLRQQQQQERESSSGWW